ncbi:MAG: TetR family transcriptional regulator [Erysipelotrichia bacterium]|nr:TetR family transcriptional regulator [Erysipelotrichia bacterium]
MKTEYRLAQALKTMMSEENSLDNISVTDLAKKCKVNRQTFYYHFHDIYDLLTLVFLNEKIEDIEDSKNVDEMLKRIFYYYSKNKNFIKETLHSAGKDLFFEFINNNCYRTLMSLILKIDEAKELNDFEKKAIARYNAAGFAFQIIFYLDNFRSPSEEGLKQVFLSIPTTFLQKAIKNVISKRAVQ